MRAIAGAVVVTVVALGVVSVGQRAYAEQQYCAQIACYGPAQLEQAYGLTALYAKGITGKGVTIGIVDPYGSATIAGDLAAFDAATGLSAPPSLTVVSPDGQLPAASDASTWAVETSLDVEYAHAMAPGARIVVAESLPDLADIISAEQYLQQHYHADVISQSLTETEQIDTASDIATMHFLYAGLVSDGVTVVASSGDTGAADTEADGATYYGYPVTTYPASDPLVTGVGGTRLSLDADGYRYAPDTVWNDTYDTATNETDYGNAGPNPMASGGGKSVLFGRPAYQNGVKDVVGSSRGVPDVSMSAACSAPVEVYLTDGPGSSSGWYPACGTSEAAPLFAGVVALADQLAGHPLGAINTALYQLAARHASGIVPVTSGGNTVSYQGGTVVGYQAGSGNEDDYSLAAGVGTIDGAAFVPELVAQTAPAATAKAAPVKTTAETTQAAKTSQATTRPCPMLTCVPDR
jgi:subtilase family serine protease